MKLSIHARELCLRDTFTTSHGSSNVRRVALVRAEDEAGRVGWGEAAPYYDERFESVLADLARASAEGALEAPWASASARSALETAALDLRAQARGQTFGRALGVAPSPVLTSFTLGQAAPAEIERRALAATGFLSLKVKIGSPHDLENLRIVRAIHPDVELRVDANGGFDEDEACRVLERLAPFRLALCEQPVPPGDPDALARVRSRCGVPVYVDEGIRSPEDVGRHAGAVDGIVVKLGKCGGPSGLLACVAAGRRAGLEVMVGCMIESSVAITAAAHLAPACDRTDLDGHLLIADDPFEGARLVGGHLVPPEVDGLGVRPRAPGLFRSRP